MKLDDFFPYILPEVLGCPDPSVRLAIVNAALTFCRDTLSWTETQDPIELTDDESIYDLDAPAGANVYTIRDAWCNKHRLEPKSMGEISLLMPDFMLNVSSEPLFYNMSSDKRQIRVFPIPRGATSPLVLRVAYIPVFGANTLPDYLAIEHINVIAAGAKSSLMLMPGLPWSNPQLGAFYKSVFDEGVMNAKISEFHDRVSGSLRVLPRRFI